MGFEHWDVGFGKNMGWEMGLKTPFRTLCLLYVVRACSILLHTHAEIEMHVFKLSMGLVKLKFDTNNVDVMKRY